MKREKIIYLTLILVLLSLGGKVAAQGQDMALQGFGNSAQSTQEISPTKQKMVGTTTIDLDSVFQSQQNQNMELIKSEVEKVKSEIKGEEDVNKLLWQCLISFVTSVVVVSVYYLIRKGCSRHSSYKREKEIEELQRQLRDVKARLDTALSSIHAQNNSSQNRGTKSTPSHQQEKKKRRQDFTQQTVGQQAPTPKSDLSSQQVLETPADVEYVYLTLSDKQLVPAGMGQTAYYRAWHSKGKIYFEFFCDAAKIMKAINNRDSLIAPCCTKASDSIEPNEATSIKTVHPGELNNNFQVINQAIIKYF